jgi:hypothetical protein
VPVEQGVEQAGETVSLLSPTSNEGVQATAYSARSCLAPAFSRA